jgi:histidinol-phosphate aminotransferase
VSDLSSRIETSELVPPLSRRALGRSIVATLGIAAWPDLLHGAVVPAAPAPTDAATPIRLGANENPNGLGPAAVEAVRRAPVDANRYPGESVQRLVTDLAAMQDVPREQVLVTPGSGEILRASTLAFTSASRALVTASPTFEAPGRAALQTGAPVRTVRVLTSGSLDLSAMADQASGAGLFFVCNPNNPTGGVSSAAAVTDFVARVRRATPDAIVLIDEAYFEYVDDPSYATAIPLIRTDPKVIVSRTFSKIHGMAGLRVGYAIGHPDALGAMRKQLSQGTLSGLSAATAAASLADRDHVKQQIALNREARAFTRRAFESAGYQVLPSEANFLMVDVRRDVSGVQTLCRQAGVLIARAFPPLTTHARISIGTLDEMKRAVDLILPRLATPASARLDAGELTDRWNGECC